MNKVVSLFGAVFGLLSVVLGAFGAHALKPMLLENGRLDAFETAVKYMMFHAIVLLILGFVGDNVLKKGVSTLSYFIISGIILFSGSIFILCLNGPTWFGPVTPIGGTLLIVGWVILIVNLFKLKQ